jgi:hypothetical protein
MALLVTLALATLVLAVGCREAQTQREPAATPFPWRGQHVFCQSAQGADTLVKLIDEHLAPMGISLLVVEVNYNYQFTSHPEIAQGTLDKAAAGRIAEACRKHGIRVVPLLNCLGHQSWAKTTFSLLTKHPDFDETPQIPLDNPDIYCRSWCPLNPDVNAVVFGLMDELLDAFQADALHVGMDEVFLIGSDQCPRCKGKDPAELFAKAVNDYHEHLVGKRKVEMLMWGDRLLDGKATRYGAWEASTNGTAPAIAKVPRDIVLCDWHYGLRETYPSLPYFQEQGFRVLVSPWNKPEAAQAFVQAARDNATDKLQGVLFTGWSAGDGGKGMLAALRGEGAPEAGGMGEANVLKHCIGACFGKPFEEAQ